MDELMGSVANSESGDANARGSRRGRNDRTPRYICLYRMSDSFVEAVQIRSAVLHLHSAVQELKDTITAFNVAANKQSKNMIRLTWVIAILTFLLLVLVVQIWLAILTVRQAH